MQLTAICFRALNLTFQMESISAVFVYVFVYVYKVHMCIYMLGSGMRFWTNLFFSFTYFPLWEKKVKAHPVLLV